MKKVDSHHLLFRRFQTIKEPLPFEESFTKRTLAALPPRRSMVTWASITQCLLYVVAFLLFYWGDLYQAIPRLLIDIGVSFDAARLMNPIGYLSYLMVVGLLSLTTLHCIKRSV